MRPIVLVYAERALFERTVPLMSIYWFKNFVGMRQSDFEMLRVPNPSTEFCIHVTMRSVQTGALLGSVLGPLSAMFFEAKHMNSKKLTEKFVNGGTSGAMIGALMGPVLTYLALRDMNTVKLYDKCYRLRFDKQQLWQDRTCIVSAAIGYLSSGSLGFVVGLDLAVIMSNLMGKAW
ncbi:hypothetical protein ANCDUO_18772 [Ancylostoma duodenale]|nr:hypothetical protein ANCDUO_18772 [Ancylostoma duodenale]